MWFSRFFFLFLFKSNKLKSVSKKIPCMALTFNPNLFKILLNSLDSFIAKDQLLLILIGAKSNPFIL